ncbi:peptidoglycan-N-acetylglucosamine deacetylase [Entomortierella parvispora]|uniref:Peptidoglycan-N-acetylglucosamine deacetylase n=1 Tax=Entomortierella parvispora TaxID=205924 RepID=A0A9P3H431_9FUNG|nr:peptidoglycan-N-acetylglucosamine deacetylase [Entomortierella parvispora]
MLSTLSTITFAFVAITSFLSSSLSSPIPSSQVSTLVKRTPATIITACTVPNSFAITFDDGPSIWTHELLDYLAIKNVKVTFFVNGLNYNLITDPPIAAVVKRAHDEGHQIGSHTWAHADISAPGVDVASQMKMLDDALLKIIGVRPIYMRPPYGNTSPESLEYLGSQGYKVINWNVDTNDWRHPEDLQSNIEAYFAALQDPAAVGKGFISLQHDAQQPTAEILSKLAIEYALSKGFQVMPVGTCLGDPTGWYRL